MSKYIHNLTEDSITLRGFEISSNDYFQIPFNQERMFANDDAVFTAISNASIAISKDGVSDLTTISSQINFLKDIDLVEVDSEGRQIIRTAAARAGWSYIAHPFEFETSTLNSLYSKKIDNTDRADVTVKYYNASDVEVTVPGLLGVNEATIVKTVLLFKPNYDYELISGNVRQEFKPSTDVRLWVAGGVIELGNSGIKEFVGGINLRYIGADEELRTDGRVAKYLTKTIVGIPYQGNQMQVVVRHDAGVKHKIQLMLEYYRS